MFWYCTYYELWVFRQLKLAHNESFETPMESYSRTQEDQVFEVDGVDVLGFKEVFVPKLFFQISFEYFHQFLWHVRVIVTEKQVEWLEGKHFEVTGSWLGPWVSSIVNLRLLRYLGSLLQVSAFLSRVRQTTIWRGLVWWLSTIGKNLRIPVIQNLLVKPSSIITCSSMSIIYIFSDRCNPWSLWLWLGRSCYIVEQVIEVIEITVSTFVLSLFSTFKIF